MDELRNTVKGKSTSNLNGMIKRTDSSFMTEVLNLLPYDHASSPLS